MSELLTPEGGTRITCFSDLDGSTGDVGSGDGWVRRAADNSRCDDIALTWYHWNVAHCQPDS
jgi:hypothetical protein